MSLAESVSCGIDRSQTHDGEHGRTGWSDRASALQPSVHPAHEASRCVI